MVAVRVVLEAATKPACMVAVAVLVDIPATAATVVPLMQARPDQGEVEVEVAPARVAAKMPEVEVV